jgi:hypothetical protein
MGNKKDFHPFKKLISGIISLGFGFFMIYMVGEKGVSHCEKVVLSFFNDFLPNKLGEFISIIFSLILAWLSVKHFVSGCYKVIYFNQYLETFDSGHAGKQVIVRGNDSYRNINRILEYRESKMCGMNDRDAAELVRSTSFLNTISSGYSGRNSARTLNFVESRLAGMSGERGIQFVQGHIK